MKEDRAALSEKQKKYLIGLLLMAMIGLWILGIAEDEEQMVQKDPAQLHEQIKLQSAEEKEAKQLEELLEQIEGAGVVKVMVRFAQSDEIIYATEKRDIQIEQQGEVQQKEINYEETIAMQSVSAGEQPSTVKLTTEPRDLP